MVIGNGALGELMACVPKLRLGGAIEIDGVFAVPFPDRVTVCGLPATLFTIVSAAVRAPVLLGVKVTFTVALLPGVIVMFGGAIWLTAKSAAFVPVTLRLVMTRFPSPVLVIVTGTGVLLLRTT